MLKNRQETETELTCRPPIGMGQIVVPTIVPLHLLHEVHITSPLACRLATSRLGERPILVERDEAENIDIVGYQRNVRGWRKGGSQCFAINFLQRGDRSQPTIHALIVDRIRCFRCAWHFTTTTAIARRGWIIDQIVEFILHPGGCGNRKCGRKGSGRGGGCSRRRRSCCGRCPR